MNDQRTTKGRDTDDIEQLWQLAAIGRLAAAVVHEINNPLAGIKNAFELVSRAVPKYHPSYHYVPRIRAELDRLAQITRQVLYLYRPALEEPTDFEIGESVRYVACLLETKCAECDVRLDLSLPSTQHLVCLPHGSFVQILFNVIQNGLEASPAGGAVHVTVSIAGDRMTIVVVDNGGGIPEAVLARLFEPCVTTKSDPRAGFGLGLSISQTLAGRMGGSIELARTGKDGTTWRLLLPTVSPGLEATKR